MERENKAVFMVLVTGRKNKEPLLVALGEAGVNFIDVIYGKGAVSAGLVQNILGLIPEENKVVVIALTTHAKADSVYKMLLSKFDFDQPNTGMAFTIPVEAITY